MINRNRAPFSLRGSKPFAINEDPEKLDAVYQSLLGGNPGISEEIKLQAVTHKSFDHGWQPYNEKLAFFGECFFYITLTEVSGLRCARWGVHMGWG